MHVNTQWHAQVEETPLQRRKRLKKEKEALRRSLDKTGERARRGILLTLVFIIVIALLLLPDELQVSVLFDDGRLSLCVCG